MAWYLKRSREDPLLVRPTVLSFPNVQLDENGGYRLDLKNYKLRMGKQMEVSLSEMYVDTEDIHNISEKTRFVKTTGFTQPSSSSPSPSPTPSGQPSMSKNKRRPDFCLFSRSEHRIVSEINSNNKKEKTIYYPTCRLATLKHVCEMLHYILESEGVIFTARRDECEMVFTANSEIEKINFDLATARILGLLRSDLTTPTLTSAKYQDDLSWNTDDNTDDARLTLGRKKGKAELKIRLPYDPNQIVWNYISEESSQKIVVGFDCMKTPFTGTQLTKTLAVVTIEPKQDKLVYNPWSSNWKKVEEGEKNHIMLSFTDTTRTLFKNLKLSFTLVFRTSFLV